MDLLPNRILAFRRQRWLTSLVPLSAWCLLANVHHLLSRTLARWLSEKSKGAASSLRAAAIATSRRAAVRGALDVSSSSDEDGGGHPQQVEPKAQTANVMFAPVQQSDPKAAWADLNKVQRKSASKFGASKPETRLLVECIALTLGLTFVRGVENISSMNCDHKRFEKHLKGQGCQSRMSVALEGKLEADTCAQVAELSNEASSWRALSAAGHTVGHAALAFAMIYSQWCALEHLCFVMLHKGIVGYSAVHAGFVWFTIPANV